MAKTGRTMSGRAFAKAGDFSAAIRRGDIHYAVVDAPYLAALGVPYTVLAVAERGGATQAAWEVVTSLPARTLAELRGKTVAVPTIGARDEAFVSQVLLEAEVPKDFFAKITYAPDALSALAAIEHGRAEVAIVAGRPRAAGGSSPRGDPGAGQLAAPRRVAGRYRRRRDRRRGHQLFWRRGLSALHPRRRHGECDACPRRSASRAGITGRPWRCRSSTSRRCRLARRAEIRDRTTGCDSLHRGQVTHGC